MKRVTFEKIPGMRGRLDTPLTLVVYPPEPKKVKKLLTLTNKSVKFRLKRAKDGLGEAHKKIVSLDAMNTPKESDLYVKALGKIEYLKLEVADLEERQIETFYADNGDGSLTIPAGFWWLCDSIDGNAHLNTTLRPYYLPELRPYQIEGLTEAYKYKRATIELATGLGKSKMIASIALAGVASDKRVVICVPTEYLVTQMYYQLKALHAKTTALGGDFKHLLPGWDILVTTVDSAPKIIDEAEILIVDEGHHSPAATWAELQGSAINASHMYNFTATAFRADGMDLAIHAFGGPTVYSRDGRWGLDQGWLCPFKAIQVRVTMKRPDGKTIWIGDMMPAQRAYAQLTTTDKVMTYVRDRLLAGLSKKHRIMCIFKTVKAGLALRQFCRGVLDFSVAHANKKLSKTPKLPLKMFNDGKTDLLVACDKLVSEGIDIPNSSMLLLMTQHTSAITTLQVIGRILRKAPGKERAIMVDVALMGYAQFNRAAEKRLEIYKYLTDDVTVLEIEL